MHRNIIHSSLATLSTSIYTKETLFHFDIKLNTLKIIFSLKNNNI